MVSFAATRQVNPPGASPLLTADQLWRGLGIKARNPRDFVPAITACRVVEEDEDKVRGSVVPARWTPVVGAGVQARSSHSTARADSAGMNVLPPSADHADSAVQ